MMFSVNLVFPTRRSEATEVAGPDENLDLLLEVREVHAPPDDGEGLFVADLSGFGELLKLIEGHMQGLLRMEQRLASGRDRFTPRNQCSDAYPPCG